MIRDHKLPCFEVRSNQIEIITSPVDYYIALHKLISMSSQRVSMQALYLGTSPKDEFLLERISRKLESSSQI